MEDFPRHLYLSQTECTILFKCSVYKWKEIASENNLIHLEQEVDLGIYQTTAKYYKLQVIQDLYKKLKEV